MLDSSGQCCFSGVFDAFGVCDGDGSSGKLVVSTTAELPASSTFTVAEVVVSTSQQRTRLDRKVIAAVAAALGRDRSLVTVNRVAAGSARRVATDSLAVVSVEVTLLPGGQWNSFSVQQLQTWLVNSTSAETEFRFTAVRAIVATPVCGNAVCESGESNADGYDCFNLLKLIY